MTQYRSRPTVVEATQSNKPGDHPAVVPDGDYNHVVIGKQGPVSVDPGDWIIQEPDGRGYYPCKPEVFAAKYEPIG